MTARRSEGQRLATALIDAGFVIAGRKTGVYVQFGWPDSEPMRGTLLVPLDDTYADYPDLLGAVTAELRDAAHRGDDARRVLNALGEGCAVTGTPACPSRYASTTGPTAGTVVACQQTGLHTIHSNLADGPDRVTWISGDDNEVHPAPVVSAAAHTHRLQPTTQED